MQGILITCNMNERKCTAEAFNLLNEYAEKLYGPEKVSPGCFRFTCTLTCEGRESVANLQSKNPESTHAGWHQTHFCTVQLFCCMHAHLTFVCSWQKFILDV